MKKRLYFVFIALLILNISACRSHEKGYGTKASVIDSGLPLICVEGILDVIADNTELTQDCEYEVYFEIPDEDEEFFVMAYLVVCNDGKEFISYIDYVCEDLYGDEYVYPYVAESEKGWELGDIEAHAEYDIYKYAIADSDYYQTQVIWLDGDAESSILETSLRLKNSDNQYVLNTQQIITWYENELLDMVKQFEKTVVEYSDSGNLEECNKYMENIYNELAIYISKYEENSFLKEYLDYTSALYQVADIIIEKHTLFKEFLVNQGFVTEDNFVMHITSEEELYSFNYWWTIYTGRGILLYSKNAMECGYYISDEEEAKDIVLTNNNYEKFPGYNYKYSLLQDYELCENMGVKPIGSPYLQIYQPKAYAFCDIDGDGNKELLQLVEVGDVGLRKLYYICIRRQEKIWDIGYKGMGELFVPPYYYYAWENWKSYENDKRLNVFTVVEVCDGIHELDYILSYECNHAIAVADEFNVYCDNSGKLIITLEDKQRAFTVERTPNGYFNVIADVNNKGYVFDGIGQETLDMDLRLLEQIVWCYID